MIMEENVIRRRVVVRGRVQGVFYRDSCRQQAHESGVTGWVSNEPDGSVLAVFEGSPEAVERLIVWCRTGPPSAVVRAVDVDEEPPRGERRFSVR